MHRVSAKLSGGVDRDQVLVNVVGCGGTGSHVVNQLSDINYAMVQSGHPGLKVVAWDDDVVAWANVGRQAFYAQDVGKPKSSVLIDRVNMYNGLDWSHRGRATTSDSRVGYGDILVGCVDTKKSRRVLRSVTKCKPESCYADSYIIECGNARTSGQILLGQYSGDLPNPYAEHNHLTKGKEEKGGGCLDPYYKQDLAVNRQVAIYVQQIIWDLLRKDNIEYRGVFFNLSEFSGNGVKVERNNTE